MDSQWVRRRLMDKILPAIKLGDGSTWVFYITSEGGDGKTVFLRQIGMELGSEDGIKPGGPWSGILDLYHSDVNSSSDLEERIIKASQRVNDFAPYQAKRDYFNARRAAGAVDKALEEARRAIGEQFASCFNAVTAWDRLVIALDTTERIQHQADEFQERCQLAAADTGVRSWLLTQLKLWRNCVVLLVGRPAEQGKDELLRALKTTLARSKAVHFVKYNLGPFDEEEADHYFSLRSVQLPEGQTVDPDLRQRLWQVTGGRPIRLELAMEVIRHGLELDRFLQEVMAAPSAGVRSRIDRTLIDHVMRGEPDNSVRDVLRYLAVARNGLDSALLAYLAGNWTQEECQKRLQAVAKRFFVKRHADDERLFLHDEMYQLCDEHLHLPEEVQKLSKRLAAWYDAQEMATDNAEKQQDRAVDSLLYRLRESPSEGYHWYARRAEEAIHAAQTGFDTRLHNELMGFLRSRSPIDQRLGCNAPALNAEVNADSASRWVKRLMARGDHSGAVELAAKAVSTWIAATEPDLALADLRVSQALATIYSGHGPQAVQILAEQIAQLQRDNLAEAVATEGPETYAGWRRNLVLGRAHNHLGYTQWMDLGHYTAAVAEFRAALIFFRASDLDEEAATTKDNLARVYALLRHQTRAMSLVDDGLATRKKLKARYREALSLNSKAIIHIDFDEPDHALPLAMKALDVFQELRAPRGIGLAKITLGRALRSLGMLSVSNTLEARLQELREAADMLEQARAHFAADVQEPVRSLEVLIELGCTYRDYATLALQSPVHRFSADTVLGNAFGRLREAVDTAQGSNFLSLSVRAGIELARAYLVSQDFDRAAGELDKAETQIPLRYRLQEGVELAVIPEVERIDAHVLRLSEIELERGNIVFGRAQADPQKPAPITGEALKGMVKHYVFSAVYDKEYAPWQSSLRAAFAVMYDHLRGCSFRDIMALERILPELAHDYHIKPEFLKFAEDALGLEIDFKDDTEPKQD